ncbi:MAG: serine/threonine protein kinase [Gemmatimonadota bacterium]|nr:serine/threonine protein kinase [Gemmatimonadota bacterium]
MHDEPYTTSAVIRRAYTATAQGLSGATLPDDLVIRSAKRLRALALVYAFVFFMSSFSQAVFFADLSEFESFHDWGPSAISILVALVVAWVTTRPQLTTRMLMTVGLTFAVVGSFGIAMAQYWGVYEGLTYQMDHLEIAGLSWVAPWVMLFSIVIPAKPGKALIATVASVSAVPITMALTMKYGGTTIALAPEMFVVGLIFPYLLIILMTHVGARAIYRLGTDVARAREMGSYRLVERLGQGGMGEVWRAKHRMLARPAAIKLVRPEVLEGGGEHHDIALKRFTQEAQATASMRSPHTIELYDFGVSAEGTFYYVMELLDGFDLETLVEKFGPIPAERAVHLIRQVCHSLAEAHEHGLIHRDIKPANIYVCRYGRDLDFVKVLDFGLVKHRRERENDLKLTAPDVVSGTPGYISPEQVAGDQPIDGRTDIYCLGCVAYWLLTGHLVFQGSTAMRTMVMHLNEEPVPPSQRTELEIPAVLEQIIMQCLEKDPAHRAQTADELSRALVACETLPEWDREREAQWWETHQPAPVVAPS